MKKFTFPSPYKPLLSHPSLHCFDFTLLKYHTMNINLFSTFLFIFTILLQCTNHILLAQPASAPAPPGPTNITKILEKAGQFTTLIRILKLTQVGDQINQQLNNSNSGLTVFAPTDNAFSSLQSGTLNSLSDQQKVQLIQFHIIPSFISMSQFQTVSNPLRTQAGGSDAGEFPLNVTTAGNNQVNITTGVDNTTVSGTVYTDNQLAVYQVDKVLLPLSLFGPASPAPAPSPASAKSKKKKALAAESPAGNDVPADNSGAVSFGLNGVVAFAAFWFWL
ncbi:hypothetical protein M9H77_16085 [Catharanthus roseus]|uniref:Uncharacterized protein n=1 Tax=Catharanthus roseus TaxID=4058 RepID=A0ACC0B0A2_CATRO|nr:hypothetical protein M9H77_16085 [Catharanthus roseus]